MKYRLQSIKLFTCLFNHGSREGVVGMWTGMNWTVHCSNTGTGEIFPIYSERTRGQHSLLYSSYRVFFTEPIQPERGVENVPSSRARVKNGHSRNSNLYPLRLQWHVTRLPLPLPLPLFNDDTGFWLDNLEERDHLEDLGVNGGKYSSGSSRCGMGTWIGLFWLSIRTGGWRLRMRNGLLIP